MTSGGLGPLGKHVAHQLDEVAARNEASEATRRVLAARSAAAKHTRANSGGALAGPGRWRLALLVACTAALGLAFGVWFDGSSSPASPLLSFSVGQPARAGTVGVWERAPTDGVLPFVFSDGTRVKFSDGSRGRVVHLGAHGAEVVLESGRAFASVVPARDGAWLVRSGPFQVEVKGTEFEVSWDPVRDDFRLRLFEGRVRVSGCSLGAGQTLERGQQLRAACGEPRFAVAALDDAVPALGEATRPREAEGRPSAEADRVQERAAATTAPRPLPGAKGGAPVAAGAAAPETWRELARAGHFERAYQLATQAGYAAELERAGANDALLLGDAARLSGHGGAARTAYQGVRDRFAGDAAAARAAFALGRLTAGTSESLRWFETYLAEQPRGALAGAALDRLLETSIRLGDKARALAIARRYLAQYPGGPHAEQARELVERSAADGG